MGKKHTPYTITKGYGKHILFVKHPNGERRYAGRYNTPQEAKDMYKKIQQSNYKYDPVNHPLPERRYIYQNKGQYQVCKNGEVYGTYKSLKEAMKDRDIFIECNWDWEIICQM